jgi:hypothetical protein
MLCPVLRIKFQPISDANTTANSMSASLSADGHFSFNEPLAELVIHVGPVVWNIHDICSECQLLQSGESLKCQPRHKVLRVLQISGEIRAAINHTTEPVMVCAAALVTEEGVRRVVGEMAI